MSTTGLRDVDIERDTSIRARIPVLKSASIVMSGLPGMDIARNGDAYLNLERCELSFEVLAHYNVAVIYLLVEEHELPEGARLAIEASAGVYQIETVWMPIRDFDIPGQAVTSNWSNHRQYRKKLIVEEKSICMACLYGAGRSGMMAASLICETGKSPGDSIRYVRQYFSEAIGNEKQENWIKSGLFLSQ